VDVRAVLQVIADFTGLNIIASDTVTGNLTLRLKDVPWDQALDIIMRAKGLDKRSSGNVIWVAPREELATKEKIELEAKQAIAQLEELQTEIISLNYLRADEAQKIILGLSLSGTPAGEKVSCSTDIGELKVDTSTRKSGVSTSSESTSQSGSVNAVSNNSLISMRGSVTYDLKTNSIFLKETPTQIEKIKVLLSKVDVPARQIMIGARVVLAGDSWGRALGARLGLSHKSNHIAIGDSINQTSSALLGSPLPVNPQVNLNAPAVLGSATSAPSLGISVLNAAANTMLSLELEALEADRRGKVVSSPRVITQNQQPAVILQGQKVPNLKINSTSGGQTIEIEYKDAFLCLLVDPQVLNNDEIIMNVSVNKDTTSNPIDLPNGSRLIPIDTKRVRTTVRVKNGETAILGGVYEQELLNNTEKVPFLGDIPVLGNLFRSNIKEDKKAELLIFLTPRLLDDVVLDAR
jgi:type IV pilus assembly protein PilQ